jgi:hypothetical protein
MTVFAQPTSYSEMLTKIALFTFGVTLLLTILIAGQSSEVATTLDALDFKVKVWVFESIKVGWVVPAAIVALFARIIKLHDKVSDVFRIRENFDITEILVPLAGGVDVLVDVDRLTKLRLRRSEIMRHVFYKYTSSLKPEIDGQLVRTALDKWTWFWILLEAVTIGFLTFTFLLYLKAYSVASLVGLAVITGMLLFRQVQPWCGPTAHAEVNAILALPNVRDDIRQVFYRLS